MYCQRLAAYLQLHFVRAHHDFHAILAGERGRHLDITPAFADIGKRAAIGYSAPQTVELSSQFAWKPALSTAIRAETGVLGSCLDSCLCFRIDGLHGHAGRGRPVLSLAETVLQETRPACPAQHARAT